MRFICLIFLNLMVASAFALPPCAHWLHRQPRTQDQGFATFDSNPYYNAGLLLELFGPVKNQFRDWLRWLESGSLEQAPIEGLGFYADYRNLIIGKRMEYPIDGGLSEFSGGDTTKKMMMKLMEFRGENITNMRGDSEDAARARQKLLHKIDIQLFGLYGVIGNDAYDSLVMRSISSDPTLQASIYPRVRYDAVDDFVFTSRTSELSRPLDDFDAIAEVVAQDEQTVLVKVKLGQKPANRNQEVLQKMFFITHWQMVQKAYRGSGLFADNLETAIYLLDDFIRSMEISQANQDLYLLYDAGAWDSMMFRLHVAHKYVAIEMQGLGLQPYHYQRIADAFYPFYPSYGMIVEKHLNNEYELKRLFHNSNPDPLNMLHLEPEERGLNHQFYHEVGSQLPPHAKIVIVSKSTAHTRMYRGLGFVPTGREYSAEWNAMKDTLSGDRETFLKRTAP